MIILLKLLCNIPSEDCVTVYFIVSLSFLMVFHSYKQFYCNLLLFRCSVVSDSLRPPGLYPTRLLCPWDSLGKNSGVGCHFLHQKISRGSSWLGDRTHVSCIGRWILYHWVPREALVWKPVSQCRLFPKVEIVSLPQMSFVMAQMTESNIGHSSVTQQQQQRVYASWVLWGE